MALAEAAKQAIWIRHFLYSIGKESIYRGLPTVIYEDNQGAIKIAGPTILPGESNAKEFADFP